MLYPEPRTKQIEQLPRDGLVLRRWDRPENTGRSTTIIMPGISQTDSCHLKID
jgi:hypothetical protein